ncbi:unnamed protein product [Linum trigynum]|uniref:Uncharacterized protein n=1 Tax=Linum trigynum TaxID=586398 RepID=A0AAV2DSV3_9ROSI
MAAITAKMKLKLVVDRKRNMVIFAEAQKDFVDLLFYILSLPLSAMVKYLDAAGSSSLAKLHGSVHSLKMKGYLNPPHDSYWDHPSNITPQLFTYVPILPRLIPSQNFGRQLYSCKDNHRHVKCGIDKWTRCVHCCGDMNEVVQFTELVSMADYVKEKVQYMVSDDLTVSPLDYNSVLTAFEGFDRADVVEKEVEFGSEEALALLDATLHSKEPLTSVFLKPEPAPTPSPEKVNKYNGPIECSLFFWFLTLFPL